MTSSTPTQALTSGHPLTQKTNKPTNASLHAWMTLSQEKSSWIKPDTLLSPPALATPKSSYYTIMTVTPFTQNPSKIVQQPKYYEPTRESMTPLQGRLKTLPPTT